MSTTAPASAPETEPTVLVETRGHLGIITLNRPRAVNAMDTEMVRRTDAALDAFARDDAVRAVLLRGAGERGLCAGGDIRALHRACTEDPEQGFAFFRAEYALDLRIAEHPQPVVAFMSGLVLGGGVGVSVPAQVRVVTETTRIGMPETGIGFSPDVAGSWHLGQAPGRTGELFALTGRHGDAADALYLGLADAYVPEERLAELARALESVADPERVADVVEGFAVEPPVSGLEEARVWVDEVFAGETVEQIRDGLIRRVEQVPEDELAAQALAAIRRNSPTGMKTALEALRRAREMSIAATLDQDFRTSGHAILGHDMAEGIRAQVVDKDRNPRWEPATLEEVTREAVLGFFTPVPGEADLGLEEAPAEPVVLTEVRDGVGLLRLNRPTALNALNAEVMDAVVEAAEAWEADPSVRVIVLTGSEKAFAAGADIKEMTGRSYPEMLAADWFSRWRRFAGVRLPVVAAVNGYALGGGCELAMMCDILVAGEGARFGQPEITLGVIPGMGGSQRLTRAVGKAKAMDMVLTGRMMDAAEAERAGLVSRLVPDDAVLDTALEVARTIAAQSRPATMLAKEAVAAAFEMPLEQGLLFERRAFHALFSTRDQKEGMAAFAEKRKPRFEDR